MLLPNHQHIRAAGRPAAPLRIAQTRVKRATEQHVLIERDPTATQVVRRLM
jgi:hypothetical protein